ncbi:MAG: 16S rRNA (guanine527-N7)-methyltransferase [Planctomycetota bacterium]|jgi:16S rRNA (guanine527-N7)-methyltransferase
MSLPNQDPEEDFEGEEELPQAHPSGAPEPDPEIDPEVLAADIELDLEDVDEGEEDEDEDEEGEEGESSEEGADSDAPKPAKKKDKDAEDAEILHPDTPVPTAKVMQKALEWAFEEEKDVTPELIAQFTKHALFMLKKNREMNLTTILDPKELAAKYYLECWRISQLVPLVARRMLDLGSGGGFPGLPIAMFEPMCSLVLCEGNRIKAAYLQECVDLLGLRNVTVAAERAEDYLAGKRFDVVLVRAVSSVRENIRTLRKVRHSLKDYVMLKGNSWSREVRAAEREAERLGFKLDTVWEHELPDEMGSRAVLVYRAPGGAGM